MASVLYIATRDHCCQCSVMTSVCDFFQFLLSARNNGSHLHSTTACDFLFSDWRLFTCLSPAANSVPAVIQKKLTFCPLLCFRGRDLWRFMNLFMTFGSFGSGYYASTRVPLTPMGDLNVVVNPVLNPLFSQPSVLCGIFPKFHPSSFALYIHSIPHCFV